MHEASAPGKLVIAGEYAVLHGASALAIAVDVRARARVDRVGDGGSVLIGERDADRWPFSWNEDATVRWADVPPEGRGRILESLVAIVRERVDLPRSLPALAITLDSGAFFRVKDGNRHKLGLGSSAAVTMALTGALLDALAPDRVTTATAIEIAMAAHRALQGGAGSGIDIVAAGSGGVVSLSRGDGGRAVWQELCYPAGLGWIALWTGHSATTTDMLAKFASFRESHPQLSQAHVDDLSAISHAALAAWDHANVANLLCALAEYDAALRRLDRDAAIGIYSASHHRLAELARRHGAVYKPSGAGGGDFGLAFAGSSHVIARVREAAYREKIFTIDGSEGARGLAVL